MSRNIKQSIPSIDNATTDSEKEKKLKRFKKRAELNVSACLNRGLASVKPDVLHKYLSYVEINRYLDYIGARFANFVKIHTIGISHEGREIKAIEIDYGLPGNFLALVEEEQKRKHEPKSAEVSQRTMEKVERLVPHRLRNFVFIEGGAHAREWATISVALHCIYELTERHIRNKEILHKLRFFIVPLVNPDGYEYTRKRNRRWRKNRRPQPLSDYVGTDCNRNYDFHWEKGSNMMNRNTYRGEKPFSEPETCAVRDILQKLAPNLLFLISMHSYAQSLMYPWGYTVEPAKDIERLHRLALIGRNAIERRDGHIYRIGSISKLTRHTMGGSIVDYAYGVLKVPFALVMELPGRHFGFQPPSNEISPMGFESWYGIKEMCKHAYSMAAKVEAEMKAEALQQANLKSMQQSNRPATTPIQRTKAGKEMTSLEVFLRKSWLEAKRKHAIRNGLLVVDNEKPVVSTNWYIKDHQIHIVPEPNAEQKTKEHLTSGEKAFKRLHEKWKSLKPLDEFFDLTEERLQRERQKPQATQQARKESASLVTQNADSSTKNTEQPEIETVYTLPPYREVRTYTEIEENGNLTRHSTSEQEYFTANSEEERQTEYYRKMFKEAKKDAAKL